MKKGFLLLGLVVLFGWLATARAQVPAQPFIVSTCAAQATCCQVAVPQYTYVPVPPPGAQPSATTTSGPPPILYGVHVSNQNGNSEYLQLFNSAATPAAAATPLGASSWQIGASADRDISIGETMGITFSNGVTACCSSTQGTFTGVGSCGIILETR